MTCLEIARIHHRAALVAQADEQTWRHVWSPATAEVAKRAKRVAVVKTLKALDMLSAHQVTADTMSAHFMLLQCQARGWF